MTELVISDDVFGQLASLAGEEVERGGAVFLHRDKAGDRYLVHDVVVASNDDCLQATATEITFAPQFLSRVSRVARETGRHLGLFHTHPAGSPNFSVTDDTAEMRLTPFLEQRNPGRATLSLVMCAGTLRARALGGQTLLPVRRVGATVETLAPFQPAGSADARFDRQLRAFGEDGQAILQAMTVTIVGLGGTGSLVAQQLAHLGVGVLNLIDADTIEMTNLNRVVGATPALVGELKVDVAALTVGAISAGTKVTGLAASVIGEEARVAMCQSHAIFLCTDSHSSRAFVNEVAYQYMIPAFDMGVSISVSGGRVTAVTGRVQMLAPGLPCLLCANAISPRAIREELMSQEARETDPYFEGDGVRQPAVMSINSTAASLAVTMFLGAFTGIPIISRWQSYNALAGTVRGLSTKAPESCGLCGIDGSIGLGDSRGLSFLPQESA